MRLVEPGQSVERGWTGKRYQKDDDWCECVCHWTCQPEAGHYRALVDVVAAIDCGSEPCDPPDDSGVIDGAHPSGGSATHSVEFDVLYNHPELTLSVH